MDGFSSFLVTATSSSHSGAFMKSSSAYSASSGLSMRRRFGGARRNKGGEFMAPATSALSRGRAASRPARIAASE